MLNLLAAVFCSVSSSDYPVVRGIFQFRSFAFCAQVQGREAEMDLPQVDTCCFGLVPLRTGTMIAGIVTLVSSGLWKIQRTSFCVRHDCEKSSQWLQWLVQIQKSAGGHLDLQELGLVARFAQKKSGCLITSRPF